MRILAHMQIGFILSFAVFSAAYAGPNIPAGDLAIRQNIQRLADAGVIKGPSPTWPLAQGPILSDLYLANASNLPLSISAAQRGFRADAVDLSPEATRCAQTNVLLTDFGELVAVCQGDLFEPVADKRFDLVLCSLPKFRGQPTSAFELSWRSTEVIDKFASGLPGVLRSDGVALVLLTSHGDERGMLDGLDAAGLNVQIARRKHFGVEIMTIYRVTHSLHGRCARSG